MQRELFQEKMDGKKNVSDFHIRHNMIMQSIANMRTLNRELRKEAQEERQLEAANRSGNLLNVHGAGPQLVKQSSKQHLHDKHASRHEKHEEKRFVTKKVAKDERPDKKEKVKKAKKEKPEKEKKENSEK